MLLADCVKTSLGIIGEYIAVLFFFYLKVHSLVSSERLNR